MILLFNEIEFSTEQRDYLYREIEFNRLIGSPISKSNLGFATNIRSVEKGKEDYKSSNTEKE